MSQNNMTIEQEFTYRTNRYTPQAPIAGFVNFLSKHFYSEKDEATVEVVRRSMAEFTNDDNLRMVVSVFSNKQVASEKVVMNEQYSAIAANGEKMFSVCLVSDDEIDRTPFSLPPMSSLHPIKNANDRFYGSIQFVSIHHQLQNLVRTLSDKLKFHFNYDQQKNIYYVLGRPIDQASGEKDRFQVLIRLNIPKVVDVKQAA